MLSREKFLERVFVIHTHLSRPSNEKKNAFWDWTNFQKRIIKTYIILIDFFKKIVVHKQALFTLKIFVAVSEFRDIDFRSIDFSRNFKSLALSIYIKFILFFVLLLFSPFS